MDRTGRKSIAQRVIDRAKARGEPIDQDPDFVALLDEWINGDIDIKQMRAKYLDVLAHQKSERRGRWARRVGTGADAPDPAAEENDG
ncbi:hypothetical protein J2T09_004664 [Neorhizobium huautlense]|uniref:Antitoxin VbhA domain-containing protein n=1 Tax=Neorhizobium huautlense TaxID=67774 RepID=A0ABT9Q184_9HYPH|nr:hypothetical protein [Neorhizobium huautlense]MDP9839884.1 hypothetical protein [Neorhizobium huautlense]